PHAAVPVEGDRRSDAPRRVHPPLALEPLLDARAARDRGAGDEALLRRARAVLVQGPRGAEDLVPAVAILLRRDLGGALLLRAARARVARRRAVARADVAHAGVLLAGLEGDDLAADRLSFLQRAELA